MKTSERTGGRVTLPRVSPGFMKVFAAYSRAYVGRHFHSFRTLKSAMPLREYARPLVIYLNHASWWDPLVCLRLSREFFTDRTSFAPIESAMLARYGFFRQLGFFGIEPRSAQGARTFLSTAHAILASSANALWLTPQGRFMDVRERPLRLEEGLGALAAHEPDAAFVPLAIEYAFWTEPLAEILTGFGEPIVPREHTRRTAAEWTRTFAQTLEAAQDELAERSCRREAADWLTLDRGRSGVDVIYDVWRRLRARMRGEPFIADHFTEAQR